jgi:hypothetical protein
MFVKFLTLLIFNVLVSFSVWQVKLHLGLMSSTLGLKTVRGALAAKLSRAMICTQRLPSKHPYLEL